MPRMTVEALRGIETDPAAREAFRARVEAHRQLRTIALGEHASLSFEDSLSLQHRVQQLVHAQGLVDHSAIQQIIDAFSPLISDRSSLLASLRVDFVEPESHAGLLATFGGIEEHVYAEVEGLGRSYASPLRVAPPGFDDEPLADRILRFALTAEQISAARAGAEFGFGIDDDRMRVGHSLKRATRASLLADLD